MTNVNEIYKNIKVEVTIDATSGRVANAIETRAVFFSSDVNTGLVKINIKKDGEPLPLANGAEVLVSLVNVAKPESYKLTYTPEIAAAEDGVVYWRIPEEIRGAKARYRAGVYVSYANGQMLHGGYFKFSTEISDIDTNVPEFEEFYWQGWDEFQSQAQSDWNDWKTNQEKKQAIIEAEVAQLDTDIENLKQELQLSPAWSWSKDGTDRFTTVYPGENLVTMDSLGRHSNASVSNVTFIGPGRVNINSDGRSYIGFYTAGRQYQLSTRYSMKFKMVVNSGSVTSIGGHTTYTYLIHDISINGVSQSLNWTNGIDYNFENNKEYIIALVFTTRDTEAMYTDLSAGIFIQPNRKAYGAAFDVDISELKIEEDSATIYTPPPSEDPLNAYPKYKGLRLAPSDNPADYDWSYTDEYVDYLKSSSVSKTEFNDLASRLTALENQGGI